MADLIFEIPICGSVRRDVQGEGPCDKTEWDPGCGKYAPVGFHSERYTCPDHGDGITVQFVKVTPVPKTGGDLLTYEVSTCPECGKILAGQGYQGMCRDHPKVSLKENSHVLMVEARAFSGAAGAMPSEAEWGAHWAFYRLTVGQRDRAWQTIERRDAQIADQESQIEQLTRELEEARAQIPKMRSRVWMPEDYQND